jgi:hypothetical protein
MCACKETDVRESPNDSTLPGGEGQGSREETWHPQYRESPISSVAEHPLFVKEWRKENFWGGQENIKMNLRRKGKVDGDFWNTATRSNNFFTNWVPYLFPLLLKGHSRASTILFSHDVLFLYFN